MAGTSIPIVSSPSPLGGGDETPFHVVLVEPEIPPNTGNVARLCAATGAWLHLVEPLGFALDHRRVKRAGLDYWPAVTLSVHAGLEPFLEKLHLPSATFFTKKVERIYTDRLYRRGCVLVFGRETVGLDPTIRRRYPERCVRIPTTDDVRSLNLSNAVAIAAYEVIRQNGLG